ncbi:MAG: hypothetical protein HOP35_17565 [Nitrospira sp.]|nr:hypothetical protein [Nitrospira sp.]
MKQIGVRIGLGVILCGLLASPATAALITYNFTGDVTHVHSQLTSSFSTNPSPSAMSGFVTLNTVDTNVLDTKVGNYTVTNFSVTIGSYTATMGTSGLVEIKDGTPGLDRVIGTINSPNGPNVNFLAPRLFDVQLRGPAGTFSGDALPTTAPSISSFTNFNRWRLIFGPEGNGKVVRGTITSLTAVPLPTAVLLFGAGLVALAGLGAGSRRQRKNSLA